jgi:5-carboxymethyl-2-hydroxymuconic-semialdehyde dehydrogenase
MTTTSTTNTVGTDARPTIDRAVQQRGSDLPLRHPAARARGRRPNIHPTHLDRIAGFVDRARADGARVVFGGEGNLDAGAHFYRPTLIADARPGSEILMAEVFGPVLTVQTFDSDDEAVELANNTEYGLAAVLVTSDRDRAERVSTRLVAGTVWVNCFYVRDLRAPFGGSRRSGVGREGGTWSVDFYSDVKNTVYAPDGWGA